MDKRIAIAPELSQVNEKVGLIQVEGTFTFNAHSEQLWESIDQLTAHLEELELDETRTFPSIQSLRATYKACGKAPSRYRSSCEAMMRRIVQGKGLYQVNTAVDLGNYISLSSKYSIGFYDRDCIDGDINFSIGQEGETYKGIGRYELNMEGMPLLKDQMGGFGSPTSDSERTCITPNTKRFLFVVFLFQKEDKWKELAQEITKDLETYLDAKDVQYQLIG